MFLRASAKSQEPEHGDSFNGTASSSAGAPARVKKACLRCRIKKIKCDGHVPCSRCVSNRVTCKLDRGGSDLKELSREYISSLESQQIYLLDALRTLCDSDPGNERVRTILDRLEASGVDLGSLKNLRTNTPSQASDKSSISEHVIPPRPQEKAGLGLKSEPQYVPKSNLQAVTQATSASHLDPMWAPWNNLEAQNAQLAVLNDWALGNTHIPPDVLNDPTMFDPNLWSPSLQNAFFDDRSMAMPPTSNNGFWAG